jgi:hypothetical protein
MSWREYFEDRKAVHTRFTRWAKAGVSERVFKHLAEDADDEYAIIDSTIVRAHRRIDQLDCRHCAPFGNPARDAVETAHLQMNIVLSRRAKTQHAKLASSQGQRWRDSDLLRAGLFS